jgi:anthranilate phosphoribosyltransferase
MIAQDPEALAEMLVTGSFSRPSMVSTLKEMASRGETPREVAALATAFRRRGAHVVGIDHFAAGRRSVGSPMPAASMCELFILLKSTNIVL